MSSDEFSLEEYRSLRAEIAALMLENQTLERYAGAGCAVVAAWLLTNTNIPPYSQIFAWSIPVSIAILAALRAKGLASRLNQIGTYIRDKEAEEFKGTKWESYLYHWPDKCKKPNDSNQNKGSPISSNLDKAPFEWTAKSYWLSLITISGFFFVFGFASAFFNQRSDQLTIKIDAPASVADKLIKEGAAPIAITFQNYKIEIMRTAPEK